MRAMAVIAKVRNLARWIGEDVIRLTYAPA